MYYILLALASVGIKPTKSRKALRQHYANHERGHHNLVVYNRKRMNRAISPVEKEEISKVMMKHKEASTKLLRRIQKLK